jgi:hypothetical protein
MELHDSFGQTSVLSFKKFEKNPALSAQFQIRDAEGRRRIQLRPIIRCDGLTCSGADAAASLIAKPSARLPVLQ